MKLKETLIALAEGKKVRGSRWPQGDFIELLNDKVTNHNGRNYDIFYVFNESWEIYEEYNMNFPEALAWMMQSGENICEADDSMSYSISGNKLLVSGRYVLHGQWFENKNDVDMLLSTKFKKVEK